ncbi:putative membrane protein insertion efficiency factor [Frankia torreyi]|uniref:Putative membrane protein insertion efficiency factor n=1 Tax=Frankia torreyi TaxID=1856 RepID=A0A0D8BEI2_9ACTN|nr:MULTISPECIES: membrane protein insertion efficiency factor YidD [Frankia]KJE22688.1 putative membrane protein insertion efficiency factor [Frankia torreyi]KQM04475.1 putative membrane protein insertion efficiency factor [Frankia sp. CpI1-P]
MTVGMFLLVALAVAVVIDLTLASELARRRLPTVARTADGAVRGPLSWALAGLVRLYRAGWSGRNAGMCRFEPSCSAYALTAVRRHGGMRGGALAVGRLLRCQPLSAGGYDPVPGEPTDRPPPSGGPPETGARPRTSADPGTSTGPRVVRKPRGMSTASGRGSRTVAPGPPVPSRRPTGMAFRLRSRGRGPRSSVPVADRGREESERC